MIANLAACHIRHARIEQPRKQPRQARFGLPAQAKQDEIVTREDRVDDLRNNSVVVTHNARKQGLTAFQLADQVRPQLVLQCAIGRVLIEKAAGAKLAQRLRQVGGRHV